MGAKLAGHAIPSSIPKYVHDVDRVLPGPCVCKELRELKLCDAETASPARGESLLTWAKSAIKNRDGKLHLTLIVGETRSDYRQPRQPPLQVQPKGATPKKLTMACTCDAAGGSRAVIGILQGSGRKLPEVHFDAVIDEWPSTGPRVRDSHVLVIGTPEVNVLAAFLHGLVRGFHLGHKVWPPELESMGDRLSVAGLPYLRVPWGDETNHWGGVFLLKNPWSPRHRLLWIAGLSGRATWKGCSLVAGNWSEYEKEAKVSTAVVFGRDLAGDAQTQVPLYWLVSDHGKAIWEPAVIGPLRRPSVEKRASGKASSPPCEYDAFISYRDCQLDSTVAWKLLHKLEEAGFKVAIYERDFKPNAPIPGEMERCVKESRFTLALVSPSYLQSGNTLEEAVICKVLGMADRKQRLVPVRIKKCRMPYWMYGIVGVDFTTKRRRGVSPFDKLLSLLRSRENVS